MSALTEAIAAPTTKLCSVGKARPQLDLDSAADFDAWMRGETIMGRRITDIEMWNGLQRLGFRVAKQTLGRHRRQAGECGCVK
jgi:hypothetical protein